MKAFKLKKFGMLALVAFMLTAFLSFDKISAQTSQSDLLFTSDITDDAVKNSLKIDLYWIADIEWENDNYVLKNVDENFKSVFDDSQGGYIIHTETVATSETSGTVTPDHEAFDMDGNAQRCAQIVFAEGSTIEPTNKDNPMVIGTSRNVQDGLYFAIVRSTDKDYIKTKNDKLVSYVLNGSEDKEYDFKPYLVFVNSQTNVNLEVNIKYEVSSLLMGELIIEKEVRTFAGKPVSFVFLIEVKEPTKTEFKQFDVASISYDNTDFGNNLSVSDFFKSITISNIPVGSEVRVTEIYAGAGYKVTSDRVKTTIVSSPTMNKDKTDYKEAKVDFINDHDDEHKGGYGLNNEFRYETSGWNFIKSSGGSDQ